MSATVVQSTRSTDLAVVARFDRPIAFYGWSMILTGLLWAAAAFTSHLGDQTEGTAAATATLGLLGLAAPALVALWLVRPQPALRTDLLHRLVWSKGMSRPHLAAAVLLPFGVLLAAQAISLLFGYSPDQFHLRHGYTFTSGLVPVWVILGLAPVLEELAWHSYGTDCLVARMRLLSASGLFTVLWTVWHVPLAFVRGYYQSELVEQGWLHALNFPVSMIAFVVVMNWLYYRTGRCVAVAIIFHAASNYANEIFLTDPDSKLIQTAVLLVVAVVVVARNRDLFLGRPSRPARSAKGPLSRVAQ